MAITVYTYNDKVLKNVATDKWLKKKEISPVITLDPGIIRVKMPSGWTAADFGTSGPPGITFTNLGNDIWDCVISNMIAGWSNYTQTYHIVNAIELIAMNTTLNTSYANGMNSAFYNSTSLTKLYPDNYIVSNLTNVSSMFNGCTNIESGALALYNKLSALGAQISNHEDTFKNCGSSTVTGAAELAQIPSSWGGTAT